ncbi:MAG: DUF6063 family protein [Methanosphaera sp.]|nr:DUF6063 family protein [Clostridiales bacterium]MCD7781577.1 DUF6063 family protein [Methanosphaera sp.]MCD7799722.1 DUF6063 family protein [Ruminococcus sp.]
MTKALKIYKKLVCNGNINNVSDRELFYDYWNEETNNQIHIIAKELDFDLVELPHDIYIVPKPDNPMIGFTMKDIRMSINASARLADAYLQCYIVMFILYLFFGGKNTNPKNTEFLQIKDIVAETDKRFSTVDVDEIQEHYLVNFKDIKELWVSKTIFDEEKRSTRYGTVMSACRFLENQKLITILDNGTEIRTTQRLDDLMINYYLSNDRVKEINEMFYTEG